MVRIERSLSSLRALIFATRLTSVVILLLLVASLGTGCQSRVAAGAVPTSSARTALKAADTTVLLFADMGEADGECGCGQIIRTVRASAVNGAKIREVDTRDKDKKEQTSRRYKIMVSPAVLFLDANEKVARRFEGESSDTLKALKSELEQVTKP